MCARTCPPPPSPLSLSLSFPISLSFPLSLSRARSHCAPVHNLGGRAHRLGPAVKRPQDILVRTCADARTLWRPGARALPRHTRTPVWRQMLARGLLKSRNVERGAQMLRRRTCRAEGCCHLEAMARGARVVDQDSHPQPASPPQSPRRPRSDRRLPSTNKEHPFH